MNVKKFLAEESQEKVHKTITRRASDKKKNKKGTKIKSMHTTKEKHEKKSKKSGKIEKVMEEFALEKLHSGSKKGPLVTNPQQALAIAYSEKRRAKKKK